MKHFPLRTAGKRPAPIRGPRPSQRLSAVEARELFPLGGDTAPRKGRFPVARKIDRTLDGVTFASKAEMTFYAELRRREALGEVADIVCQPHWDVELGGKPYCRFTPDFSFRELFPEICDRIVEVKSSGTRKDAAYRLRRKAAELAFGLKIEEVL